MYTTLISAPQLQTWLASGQPCLVFDCSFDLAQPDLGDAQFAQAHIPGALRADLNRDLSHHPVAGEGPDTPASGGRHPLPSRTHFAAWLGRRGLTPATQVVVYDRQGTHYCGRLWWMLKWAGHEAVAVLDGGLQAWQAEGGAVHSGVVTPADSGHAHPSVSLPMALAKAQLVTTEGVEKALGRSTQTIIDARGAPRFRGEVEPLDPVAGHIPGALNRPFTQNFDAQGKFKPAAELRAEFEALLAGRSPDTVVHHCGSGVTATPNIIAMEIAGLGRTALYAGSWSEWCSDPARPVAQG